MDTADRRLAMQSPRSTHSAGDRGTGRCPGRSPTISTRTGSASVTRWRRSWRLAASAQCRSSSTSSNGRSAVTASSSLPTASNRHELFGVAGDARASPSPSSGTRRDRARRCISGIPVEGFVAACSTTWRRTVIHGPNGNRSSRPRTTRSSRSSAAPARPAHRARRASSYRCPARPTPTTAARAARERLRLTNVSSSASSASRPKNPNRLSVRAATRRAGSGHDGRVRRAPPAPRRPRRLDRVRQTLQLQRARRHHLLHRVAPDHQPHEVGGEDLAALRVRAQPSRFDHRRAEVVAVLLGRLTGGDADPDRQRHRRPGVVRIDGLLHADRARHCTARATRTPPSARHPGSSPRCRRTPRPRCATARNGSGGADRHPPR